MSSHTICMKRRNHHHIGDENVVKATFFYYSLLNLIDLTVFLCIECIMASRLISEDSDEEFQEIQLSKLQNGYRHAREDQREYTIEKKDLLRMQRYLFS